jgi:transglutaminase-like putative cysteine protease
VNGNLADDINDAIDALQQDYDNYIANQEIDTHGGSIADMLDKMIADYVSGISNPSPSSIINTVCDPADSQELIDSAKTIVYNEAELENVILDVIRAADKEVRFKVIGGWLDSDLLYDIVFYRIHDVYMIDALGLYSYTVTITTSGSTESYLLQFEYIDGCTQEEILELRSLIDTRSKDIVRDLKLGGKSDYEKVKEINGYLCDNVYYPEKPYISHDFTPYGALLSGRAVCEGYSRAAKILCELAGLECYYVVGTCDSSAVNEGHAWNLVNIDGEWYHLDVTWNDGSGTDDYFLVTDRFMALSRKWERSNYPASASASYVVK